MVAVPVMVFAGGGGSVTLQSGVLRRALIPISQEGGKGAVHDHGVEAWGVVRLGQQDCL